VIEVFLKGLGVGIAVAAPVGPIGLLCIRRTLARGWTAGVRSGLGAAVADATYGMMVAAGFAATGLLVRHAREMQFAGGLLIALLGVLAIRTWLARAARRPAEARGWGTGALADFFSTYVLTISNPMTILAFAGLVAGLGAASQGGGQAAYVLVAGVFVGSALWWLILSSAATVLRSRLTDQTTRWLDLASGLVLLGWGAWIALGAIAGGPQP